MTSWQACAAAMIALVLSVPGATRAEPVECEPSEDVAVIKQAEQKLVLLMRMVDDTGPAKRVDEGDHEEAKAALAEARNAAARSDELLDEGCGEASMELSTSGLGRAATAFSLTRPRAAQGERIYRETRERTTSFLQSLDSLPAADRGMDEADVAGVRRQIERAEELAVGGDYAGATELLRPVVDRLERRLAAIYDRKTVYYEKKFEGPADEYAYLEQQYRGYRMLTEQLAGDRKPPYSAQQAYEDFLGSAARLGGEADGHAAAGEWDQALGKMREAVTSYERAMRLIGIGY